MASFCLCTSSSLLWGERGKLFPLILSNIVGSLATWKLQPSSSFVETPCSPLNVEVSSCGQILLLPRLTRGKCYNNIYCDEGCTFINYVSLYNKVIVGVPLKNCKEEFKVMHVGIFKKNYCVA